MKIQFERLRFGHFKMFIAREVERLVCMLFVVCSCVSVCVLTSSAARAGMVLINRP